MAYQTGQAGSSTALLDIIKTFAAANGWTVNGAMISSANSWTDIESGTSFNARWSLKATTSIRLTGYSSASRQDPSSASPHSASRTSTYTENWPCVYHLISRNNPDELFCIIDQGAGYFNWLSFGELDKGAANYVGGSYVACSETEAIGDITRYYSDPNSFTSYSRLTGGYSASIGMFMAGTHETGQTLYQSSLVRASIDGQKWRGDVNGLSSSFPLYHRTPNKWNSQAVLLPIRIMAGVSAGYYMDLGCVSHARLLRIDNYNPGDIITLGSEKWIVFPFIRKVLYGDPQLNSAKDHTGPFGWAIRYDGP